MLSLARKRDHAITQVKYVHVCGEHIPLNNDKVLIVFMSMVLHHLEDIDARA
jgi:ubiquinone/menaquinone biosynthesis C-methylase UbiE